MESQLNLFGGLSLDIQYETAQQLITSDLLNFALASKTHLTLFKPILDVRQFLHLVVSGQYEAVKKILRKNSELMHQKGRVIDCSGRVFEPLSGFQYALWALDKYMWTVMLEALPETEQANVIRDKWLAQYHQVKSEGIIYRINGKKMVEKHFDFENTLIKSLKAQLHLRSGWKCIARGAIDKQWVTGVGVAQKLVPMHVVYEYCADRKYFLSLQDFISQSQPLTGQLYSSSEHKGINWFEKGSKLGIEFAINLKNTVACRKSFWASADGSGLCSDIKSHLAFMQRLYEVRIKDSIHLEKQLESQIVIYQSPISLD